MTDGRGVTVLKAYSATGYLDVEFEVRINARNELRVYRLLLQGMNSRLESNDDVLIGGSEYVVKNCLQNVLDMVYSLNKWNATEFISYLYGWSDGYQVAVAKQY